MPASHTYLINHRELTAFNALDDELKLDNNTLFELPHLSVLDVIGPQARDFLQGQLSCDLREVDASHMRAGAMCNLKGRVLMLLDVLDWQGMHLILPRDQRDRAERLLAKPAVFSRVTFKQAPQYAVFGFYLHDVDGLTPFGWTLPRTRFDFMAYEEGCCYALGQGAYIILIETTHQDALTKAFIQQAHYKSSLAWHALRLSQGHVEIYPESSGLFLPHRLDLQRSGYLSFNKGCYKGQEIIARTHYRATLKHTLKQFTIQSNESLQSGLRLLSTDGQELGELIDFCPLNPNQYAISVSIFFEHPMTVMIEGHQSMVELHAIFNHES